MLCFCHFFAELNAQIAIDKHADVTIPVIPAWVWCIPHYCVILIIINTM